MRSLVMASSLRDVAARVGLGHEALRKFINGLTTQPHERNRRAMAELYLEGQRLRLADAQAVPTAGHLKLVLPRGLDAAVAEVEALFEVLRAAGNAPKTAEALEAWLLRKLREEYAAEPQWGRRRPRKR